MENLLNIFDNFVHEGGVSLVIGVVGILAATFILERLLIAFLKRVLKRSSLLPSSSIFLIIARVAVWAVGLSFLLSTCFNVNVSGMITALGVGGIAISLGFQDTISNLIGGLQVSLSRIVEPGDRIQIGQSGVSGTVCDVSWRYTTLDNGAGSLINVPNALMTSSAVIKLPTASSISIPVVVTADSERLTNVAHRMEAAAKTAVERVSKLKKDPSVTFSSISDTGYVGTLAFVIADGSKASFATDAAIRAVAPFAHNRLMQNLNEAVTKNLESGASQDLTL